MKSLSSLSMIAFVFAGAALLVSLVAPVIAEINPSELTIVSVAQQADTIR